MKEGYSVRQLSQQSGHSPAKLRRIINYWLARPPNVDAPINSRRYVVCDGTMLRRRRGPFVVMDGVARTVIAATDDLRENVVELRKFFHTLKQRGLEPQYATIDGNPCIAQALTIVWPEIVIQRCLVHIQRQGLSWCRRKPKRTDAKKLRMLLLGVTKITSDNQAAVFLGQLQQWEKRYGCLLAQTKTRGWVLSDLQRARSMLLRAQPMMFTYLNNENVPRSTNALEGYFSRLKLKLQLHRGLRRRKQRAYFEWYFHLCKK